jgi:hypothetical protein
MPRLRPARLSAGWICVLLSRGLGRRGSEPEPASLISKDTLVDSFRGSETVSRFTIVPWLQLAPFAQFARYPCLDEVSHEGPCVSDSQDEVATECSQVIHDRDADHGSRGGAVPDEQG